MTTADQRGRAGPRARREPRRRTKHDSLEGLRCGAYLRVSRADADARERDNDEKSIRTQRRSLERTRRRLKFKLIEYAEAMSASRFATATVRPKFELLIADVRAGKLDVVWIWDVSRSSRRLADFIRLRDICRDHNVLWVVLDTPVDPADENDMMPLLMQAQWAEYETERMSKRIREGKETAAMEGWSAVGPNYGYRRRAPVGSHPAQGDEFDEEPEQARWVRWIFEKFLEGWSLYRMWNWLQDQKVPTPAGAEKWQSGTLRGILTNPAYIGLRTWRVPKKGTTIVDRVEFTEDEDGNTLTARWKGLVRPDEFYQVREILKARQLAEDRPMLPGGHKLSSVAECQVCGAKVAVGSSGYGKYTAPAYRCREKGCVSARKDALDDYVDELVLGRLADPAYRKALSAATDSEEVRAARAARHKLQAQLLELDQAAASDPDYNRRLGDIRSKYLNQQLDAVGRQLAAAQRKSGVLALLAGDNYEQVWDGLLPEQQRNALLEMVRLVIHRAPGRRQVPVRLRIEVHWLFGPDDGGITTADVHQAMADEIRRQDIEDRLRDDKALRLSRDGMSAYDIGRQLDPPLSESRVYAVLTRARARARRNAERTNG